MKFGRDLVLNGIYKSRTTGISYRVVGWSGNMVLAMHMPSGDYVVGKASAFHDYGNRGMEYQGKARGRRLTPPETAINVLNLCADGALVPKEYRL